MEKAKEIVVFTSKTEKPFKKRIKWTEIVKDVLDNKQPIRVSGITRGQAYALKRRAIELGARVKVLDRSRKVLVAPPKEKHKKPQNIA